MSEVHSLLVECPIGPGEPIKAAKLAPFDLQTSAKALFTDPAKLPCPALARIVTRSNGIAEIMLLFGGKEHGNEIGLGEVERIDQGD
nr:hypothetical protein [uncultured Rhodopila sp.]